ncbi:unnamed protein product [Linum trigynum]
MARSTSSPIHSDDNSDDDDVGLRYTSLKDIISGGSPTSHLWGAANYHHHEGNGNGYGYEFDPSSIAIRNHLVKHAASAYVSAATIISIRERSCMESCWEKVASFSCLVWGPLGVCFAPFCH